MTMTMAVISLFVLKLFLILPIPPPTLSLFIPPTTPLSSPISLLSSSSSSLSHHPSNLSSSRLFMTKPLPQHPTEQEQQQQEQQEQQQRRNGNSNKKKGWNTSLFPKPPRTKSQTKAVTAMTTQSTGSLAKITPVTINTNTNTNNNTNNELLPQTYVQLLAIGIGIVTGISVAGFKLSINAIRQFSYGEGFQSIWTNFIFFFFGGGFYGEEVVQGEVPYWIIPVLGGVMVTILNHNFGEFSPGLRGAVQEVDDDSLLPPSAIQNKEWDLRPFRKALGATFTLGTGNSLGPEGPGVEIGVAVSRFYMMLWPTPPQPTTTTTTTTTTTKDDECNNNNNNNNNNNKDSSTIQNNNDAKYPQPNLREELQNHQATTVLETISRNRLLLACGAAAGVSSGFNAPLSGVFFALEVVQAALPSPLSIPIPNNNTNNNNNNNNNNNDDDDDDAQTTMTMVLQQQSLSGNPGSITAILISSVVSALVSRIFLGDELALRVLTDNISTPLSELPLYSLLGVCCGIVSVVFAQTAKLSKDVLEGDAGPSLLRKYIVQLPSPILGGITCGLVGYIYPQILFFGYETLNGLLGNETLATELLLVLLLAKIFTTAVSAGSGLVGGTLAPSLFMGGMTGASFHNIVSQGFVQLHIPQTILLNETPLFSLAEVPIYSSVGAASVLAATFRAPLTASLLLFEITRDYDVLLPLLVSAGVASLASDIIENTIIVTSENSSSKQ